MAAIFTFPPISVNTTGLATSAGQTAILNKMEAVLVTEPHDYRSITYVGASTRVSTVVYKLGGAGGTTVATLTLAYDGSDRLTSVTKS